MPFLYAAGEIPAAESLGELNTYTPTLTAATTNPNLGTEGVATGAWIRTGPRLVVGWARILFSGTGVSGGSGRLQISAPLPMDTTFLTASATGAAGHTVGVGRIRDPAGTFSQNVAVQLESPTLLWMQPHGTNSSVSGTSPFTIVAGTRFAINFQYIIEAGV